MSHIDNLFNQVRSLLQSQAIKLWEEPYYSEDLGSIEASIELLADEFSDKLGIDASRCKCVIVELQDNALRKLAARREFNETGLATFKVRRIDNRNGTTNILDIKCDLNELGSSLQAAIAAKLQLSDANHVKCISAGRIVSPNATLASQQLKNNQQLIVIIGQGDNHNGALHDRINKIKEDVEAVVASQNQLMEMEDQDGNPVFLPPNENRALLTGMGYCEKARSAMHREDYEEALLLLLEADEQFNTCNSKFLESVDNYALINLDIVWCYLCLRNVSQLPDADRRLNICERSCRSYGENYSRLYALKGRGCPERALIMRLQLLQGVVLFHQNRRDAAYERFEAAAAVLSELKVNDEQLLLLVEMGFDVSDARLALRSSSGNVERAVQFIQQRKQQLSDARTQSKAERAMHRRYAKQATKDSDWVNPRSVCTLTEMGFDRRLAAEALKRTENDVPRAVELLQTGSAELGATLPAAESADNVQLAALLQLGFLEPAARAALESTRNNLTQATDFLLKAIQSEEELLQTVERVTKLATTGTDGMASTSQGAVPPASLIDTVLQKAKAEIDAYQAYKRLHADLSGNDQDYLDLPLLQEEQLLAEYRNLLEQ
ncbi:NEDD8 ultimate buster 1-like [Drosophila innubila]|uniref:NEDD8 ultimate buster 1-like n=1 Tax=Drosophila innubila TaxID=198719 RepID=UPI00148C4FCF|nr:NEDD8 ultimate buster 1-like [Drosophila innubila]XP_034490632.1 NEDD8 ultimate buster 1-like [Drosophila innubila]